MIYLEKEWLAEFKKYLLVERQYSAKTALAYEKDLQNFVTFLEESGGAASFATISNLDVHAYMSYLYEQN
ncbi:MAG: site-specific integrase, partial [Ligilactobacillus agilis]